MTNFWRHITNVLERALMRAHNHGLERVNCRHKRLSDAVYSFGFLLHNIMEESATRRAERTMMSSYGLKTYTHDQTKEQWRESMKVKLASFYFTR